MADTKITALTALTAADPANDVLPIVDVSDTTMAASGTTKKISVNNILGCSGTATLASATITGDLTVDTNVLKVDSTNNRVGIGTASPVFAAGTGLEIENAGIATLRLQNTSGSNAFELQLDSAANGILYRGYNASPHVFYVNNSVAMTLDASSNLGLGVTPSAWNSDYKPLQLGSQGGFVSGRVSTGTFELGTNCYRNSAGNWIYTANNFAVRFVEDGVTGQHQWYTAPSGTAGNAITFTQAMTLDASGNLIVGGTNPYAASITSYGTSTKSGGLGIRNSAGTFAGGIFTLSAGSGVGSTDVVVEGATTLQFYINNTERARIPAGGGFVVGTAAIATTATDGFLYIPTCAGAPTGVPTSLTGRSPLVVDSTNNKLYFYSGGAWVAAN